MHGSDPFQPTKNWRDIDKRLDFSSAYPKEKRQGINMYLTYPGHELGTQLLPAYIMDISKDLQRANSPVYFSSFSKWGLKRGQSHIDQLKTVDLKEPLILICCLQDDRTRTQYYNEIKQFCSNKGYLSQCILFGEKDWDKREKNRGSIIANIKKQIINKFGYLCWWTDIGQSAPVLKGKNVLMIGIDVYHSKKTLKQGQSTYRQRRSIGAFVAVLVRASGVWNTCSAIVAKEARQEILGKTKSKGDKSTDILEAPSITQEDALQRFVDKVKSAHKFNPDFIVVYRDGVGDSMLDQARDSEVPQVRRAVTDVKLAYIVVQKRIHTRFLVRTQDGTVGNPPAGTIVDKHAGSVHYPDFYLVPTTCTLSTVNPVHYVIIADDKLLPMEQLQALTYAMCYVYPNWTDSIKLPSPTQCAHKLAYLVGETHPIDPQINPSLFTSYWYL